MRWGTIALCFWLPFVNAGKVYVCEDSSGGTLYSQTPCPVAYQEKEQRAYEETSGSSTGATSEDLKRMAHNVSKNNQRIKAERDKRKAEGRMEALSKERDAMLKERSELASSIAGVNARNRGQAVVDDMKSRAKEYEKKMGAEEQKIKNANKRLNDASAEYESATSSEAVAQ